MNDQPDRAAPAREDPPALPLTSQASAPTCTPAAEHSINARIFETSLDLILVVDRKGNFLRVSPSCAAILGYQPSEMVGRSAAGFLFPEDLEHTRNEMRLARRGRVMRNFECRYVHRDGHIVPLAWTGVWSEPDEQHFFIGRDMTERIALESQLRQAVKMEAIGRLTGGLAHDFNNILAVIIGMSEVLAEELHGQAKLAGIVRTIDEAAERGAHLVQRLLAFARKQPLQRRVLDLNEIVTHMITILQRTLGEDITLKAALADGLWATATDSSQVEDALLNLAVNARDAMPKGGQLVIETANVRLDEEYAAHNLEVVPGDYVAVVVSDTGSGMPPDVVERAFEPFFTTKGVGHGSGLGLSMVYGFVKQSGGHVKIYSEAGHGTSIKLYLPRAAAAAATRAETRDRSSEPGAVGRETILVVEDDAAVRTVAISILEGLGYAVQQADDGHAALEILGRAGEIDLLFTDLVMPNGMNGRELLRKAREHRPGLKALFTSGYSEHVIAGRESDAGVPLLGKPYRKQQLAEAVRSVLDGTG
jgi:PAS domain S-box-containing protein